jgi:Tol biopolymer transport system component
MPGERRGWSHPPAASARLSVMTLRTLVLTAGLATSVHSQELPSRYYSVPTWSPDGSRIVFESNRDGEPAVYTIRPDGSALTRLTPPGTPGEQPNWSPDGKRIVFTSARDGAGQLFLMGADGSAVVGIPNTRHGFLAAFSPDGQWLLFASQDTVPSTLYRIVVMRPDGSARRRLGDPSKSNEEPRWTLDGRRVAFTQVPVLDRLPDEPPRDFVRRREQARRLLVIAPDGSDERVLEPGMLERITRDRGLSPDGRWSVYAREQGGVARLYIREEATGAERLLDAVEARRSSPGEVRR